jgi:hypothetical protein
VRDGELGIGERGSEESGGESRCREMQSPSLGSVEAAKCTRSMEIISAMAVNVRQRNLVRIDDRQYIFP